MANKGGPLRLYLCGPTVYDQVHIGNMRPVLVFDILTRAHRALGRQVTYLQNITDIDDKIRERAKREGVSERELAGRYADDYEELLTLYKVAPPTHLVRISEVIEGIKAYISRLLAVGSAYTVSSGIYFDVSSVEGYGSLANRPLDKLISNHTRSSQQRFSRYLAEFQDKRSEHDFALWKFKEEGELYEYEGRLGRPGWHTECAALVDAYFGGECDTHGGGVDLLFPHHENENAQHLALYGQPIARSWIHIGHLQVGDQKMSKSLGNFQYARDFLLNHSADTFRALILLTKPQAPLNLTPNLLKQADSFVRRFRLAHNSYWLHQTNSGERGLSEGGIRELDNLLEAASKLNFSNLVKRIGELIREEQRGEGARIVSLLLKELGFEFASELPSGEDRDMFKA